VLPGTLKIGSTTYDIIVGEVKDGWGICELEKHQIRLSDTLCDEKKHEVFIHELLHVLCEFVGISDGEKLTEEQFVNRIAPILHTVLRENSIVPSKQG
jgi:hypothetical protein